MRRIIRNRRLTPEEAAEYRRVRRQVEEEKPQIGARIRARLAQRREEAARRSGKPTVGQRIRAAREALGKSQVDVAAAAGISQGYLSQLEQDQREPTLSVAARVAGALQLSLEELAACVL